jgi:hypothetical protein
MVRPAKPLGKPSMPKVPDDMSNAALQKRVALTKILKASAPKEPATPPPPKIRIAKPR